MRKYQVLWHRIRDTGECTVAANPSIHKRLKKAVTKEKYKDTGYKIQFDIAGVEQPHLVVTYPKDATGKENKNALLFRLVKPVLLGDL